MIFPAASRLLTVKEEISDWTRFTEPTSASTADRAAPVSLALVMVVVPTLEAVNVRPVSPESESRIELDRALAVAPPLIEYTKSVPLLKLLPVPVRPNAVRKLLLPLCANTTPRFPGSLFLSTKRFSPESKEA